jgi:hypothetical protein
MVMGMVGRSRGIRYRRQQVHSSIFVAIHPSIMVLEPNRTLQ